MQNIKKVYLYLVSAIALVITVVGAIMLVNMALKAWVFPKADNYGYYPVRVNPEYCATAGMSEEAMSIKQMPECAPNFEEEQRKAEEQSRTSQRQRDAAQALSMIVIAAPVWFFHWKLARKEA